jgi:hypothetical protein
MQPMNNTNVHGTRDCSKTITNGNGFSYLYASVIESVTPSLDYLKEDPVGTISTLTSNSASLGKTPEVFNSASLGKTLVQDNKSSYMNELLKILSSVPMG